MPIPSIARFEEALGSLRIVDALPAQGVSRRIPLAGTVDEAGRLAADRPLWLTFNERADIGLDALVSKISKELSAAGHVATPELALFTLAFAFLVPAPKGGAVARANRLLSRIKTANVTLLQWFNLPIPKQWSFNMPPFFIGPTRLDKLKHRCRKAGSDYFERYESQLRNTYSIERDFKPAAVLTWTSSKWTFSPTR